MAQEGTLMGRQMCSWSSGLVKVIFGSILPTHWLVLVGVGSGIQIYQDCWKSLKFEKKALRFD